jgi:hypothetical protein
MTTLSKLISTSTKIAQTILNPISSSGKIAFSRVASLMVAYNFLTRLIFKVDTET